MMIIWFIRQTNNNNNTINCSFIYWFLVLLLLLHELHFEAAMAPIYSLICEVSRVNSYDSAGTNHYHFLDFLKSSLREKKLIDSDILSKNEAHKRLIHKKSTKRTSILRIGYKCWKFHEWDAFNIWLVQWLYLFNDSLIWN